MIDSLLSPYEGVLSAASGHIAVHEAGAIEHSGHKVLPLQAANGKIRAEAVREYLASFYADPSHPHMVYPGMVYISHPTEYGTLYTKAELSALSAVCRENRIPLYMDGARLGYALASEESDLSLSDIADLTDAFYIGGTKVGALCGEAVVFPRSEPKHFFTRIKQNGALLAKGRLLGLQFDTLFSDGLYLKIARHAICEATRLRKGLEAKGYESYSLSPTNQIFLRLTPQQLTKVKAVTTFTEWDRLPNGDTVIRLATSWATRSEDVDELIEML